MQIFIFARFVLSCSEVTNYFVHPWSRKEKHKTDGIVCLKVRLMSDKGVLIQCIMMIVAMAPRSLHVHLYMLFLCKYILLLNFFRCSIVFFTGFKKRIYLDRSDVVPTLLKLDDFVLLAETLPIFLMAYHALEVFGRA